MSKRLMPFGDRILVKRNTIGEKVGSIHLPENIQERATDLAKVVYLPENSFADSEILSNAEKVISALTSKATEGDSEALITLLRLNEFCKLKSIQVGDTVLISKYVGVDFHETGELETLTLVNLQDVIGVVVQNE